MSDLHNVPFSYSIINFTPKKKKKNQLKKRRQRTAQTQHLPNSMIIHTDGPADQYSKNHNHYNFIFLVYIYLGMCECERVCVSEKKIHYKPKCMLPQYMGCVQK